MIKSDSNHCNSSSSSSGSDCLSENSKSIDAVTQLFSNLLRSSDSSTNLLRRSPNSVSNPNLNINLSQSVKQECNAEENDKIDCFLKDQFQISSKQSHVTNDDSDTSRTLNNLRISNSKQLLSFTASNETAIFDKNKDLCTPCNSKIPVFNAKTDPVDFYESERKTPTGSTGRKPLNPETLKRNYSASKIPIRSTHKTSNEAYSQNKPPVDYLRNISLRRNERNGPSKYNHVKSKLAAYIHRPSKIDSKYLFSSSNSNNIKTALKFSLENRKNKEEYSHSQNANFSSSYHIKRVDSRTSLDTYTCDYKMPFADFNCSDCFKQEDLPQSFQKAKEHLEQAAEHCRIKLENCRIIEEHERIIDKHRRVVLEHEEKASEHKLKAIGFILNRIT